MGVPLVVPSLLGVRQPPVPLSWMTPVDWMSQCWAGLPRQSQIWIGLPLVVMSWVSAMHLDVVILEVMAPLPDGLVGWMVQVWSAAGVVAQAVMLSWVPLVVPSGLFRHRPEAGFLISPLPWGAHCWLALP